MDKYLIPVSVVVAGIAIAGAVLWNGAHPSTAPSGNGPQAAAAPTVNVKDIKTAGNPYLGQPDAPVTIAFWSDYQCPYCKAFEVGDQPAIPTAPALPDIIKNYVDTGKVRIVFMDFVFLGNDSETAALYGRAVWDLYPQQYFAWRTAMYKAQDEEGDKGFGNAASIDKLDATIPGLDAAKIKAAVAANKATYQQQINADQAEATKIGINGTPAFVIGTTTLSGAYPYSAFQQVIDGTLASS